MGVESEYGFSEESSSADNLSQNDGGLDLNARAETVLRELLDDNTNASDTDSTQTPTNETSQTQESEKCVHHWIIESPKDAVCKGSCKKCDAKKEFHDSKAGINWSIGSKRNYKNKGRSRSGRYTS